MNTEQEFESAEDEKRAQDEADEYAQDQMSRAEVTEALWQQEQRRTR